MKITKKQLKQIIKEEAELALKEAAFPKTPEQVAAAKKWREDDRKRKPWDAFFPPGSGEKSVPKKPAPAEPMSREKWREIERKRKPWDAIYEDEDGLEEEAEVEEGIGDFFRKKETEPSDSDNQFLANQYLQNLKRTKMGKQAAGVKVKHDPEFAKAFARGPKPKNKLEEREVNKDETVITKQQLEQIIKEEIQAAMDEKIKLPNWVPRVKLGTSKDKPLVSYKPAQDEPEEEEQLDDGPGQLDKAKQALSTDKTPAPDSWKYDPYRKPPEREPTPEEIKKKKQDLRSQKIGRQKEAERAARKAKRRAEMGITKEELAQIVHEELQGVIDEGFWPWQTKANKKKPSVMWKDPETGKNYWLPPDDPRVKKGDKGEDVEEGLTKSQSEKEWERMNQAANPERGKELVSKADLKRMMKQNQPKKKRKDRKKRVNFYKVGLSNGIIKLSDEHDKYSFFLLKSHLYSC